MKKWLLMIGIFFIGQWLFIMLDGTILAPNVNKLGDFASRLLEANLFKGRFTMYHNPFFKIMTITGLVSMILMVISDLFVLVKRSR